VKKIGFLSFGHWTPAPYSEVRTASDALLQSIELAVAAEELGLDGAYFRVHHFARQLGSPFPLLAAVGARTKKIEIGTAVIDMRYENPMYMAEDAGAADIIAGGRLQLGISRGSPEQVIDGWRYFGYAPRDGETEADMARRQAEVFLELLKGEGFAKPNPRPMFPNPPGLLRLEPYSEGLRERIWWGSSSNATSKWAAKLGMNLQSSTLKDDETGEPLHVQQRKQTDAYREAWKDAGHRREPRVSVRRVSRSNTGSTTTTFSASGVGAGTYYFRVRAVNAMGPGPASNEIILTVGASGPAPCAGPPAAPSGLITSASGTKSPNVRRGRKRPGERVQHETAVCRPVCRLNRTLPWATYPVRRFAPDGEPVRPSAASRAPHRVRGPPTPLTNADISVP
jgi:alkanesulfonate monooxygenase SsuD/methylene tetrahydromethanopterin reductase-like flavin-dependent oxidoreductase (luciferase family)